MAALLLSSRCDIILTGTIKIEIKQKTALSEAIPVLPARRSFCLYRCLSAAGIDESIDDFFKQRQMGFTYKR